MDKNLTERIEHYLDGQLSDAEKAAFERDLQSDSALSDAFEAYLRDSQLLFEDDSSAVDADRLNVAVPKGSIEPAPTEMPGFSAEKTEILSENRGSNEMEGNEEPTREEPSEKSKTWSYVRMAARVLMAISLFFFFQKKCQQEKKVEPFLQGNGEPSAMVHEEMEAKNESILNDLADRPDDIAPMKGELEPDTNSYNSYVPPPPTVDDQNDCTQLVKQADRFYTKGDYENAQIPLATIIQSENPACQADAWYYLGLIRLRLGDPEGTLQCLAKVDNLEKYGQDVQWYMAMAFYEMAQKDTDFRDKAIRAFEIQSETQESAERIEKSKEIMRQLGADI